MTRYTLYSVFAAASLVLLARTLAGPFDGPLPVHSPLNAESLVAVSFLLAMVLRSRRLQRVLPEPLPAGVWPWTLLACGVLVAVAFFPTLKAPLLHDSYIHLEHSARQSLHDLLYSSLVHPDAGDISRDRFFRPLGYVSYWIDYRWAGTNPALWHGWNLLLHLANCCLVWLLARRFSQGRFPATVSALIFALHGTRPEVVSWAAARMDLLATFFALAALLAVDSLPAMAALTALAVLSKESAFCLPLLVLLVTFLRPPADRPKVVRAAAVAAGVCALVFAWRSLYLRGIGGYITASGDPSVFQFSLVRSAKALLYREWAILFFPINWSHAPGLALKIGTVLMIVAAAGFLRYSNGSRRLLGVSLGFVGLAALPAQHLLLIGSDLSGARVLYLPAVGLALFWGFAVDGCHWKTARYALPAVLIFFQIAALEHNLAIWRDVALLSRRTCVAFGREMARDPRPVTVSGLPATHDGVFFLGNGFRECVALNSGQQMSRIYLDNPPAEARHFRWSDAAGRLEEKP